MPNKRKAPNELKSDQPASKRNAIDIQTAFRTDLFEPSTVTSFHTSYTTSGPYPHAVVSNLIQDQLLRAVRAEITENIHFTLKETDIYRIHQSGDLANLSNLDQESLKRLPSLVTLRDALYSTEFRDWVSQVTGAGKVSGKKTDMAVNVYTPGSYLLCHDDVIGSRRVSYILYLTDPDDPWQESWGGGLRLYPTEEKKNVQGDKIMVPRAKWSLTIPPGFSQLSFFAVRPGESYHDVEEVYHGRDSQEDKRRIRMAVSGWFHIPQEGEDGFEEGLEEAQAQKSSLAQLQGAADEFDEPRVVFRHFDEARVVANATATGTEEDPGDADDLDEDLLTEQDLTFLLQYIAPGFLVPDKLEELSAAFGDMSMLQLDAFLAEKFTKQLRRWIEERDGKAEGIVKEWPLSRPPHKHRYAYLSEGRDDHKSPVSDLLNDLLHSHAFKKWLALATGLKPAGLIRQYALARCFRAGHDYALANTYTGEQPRLEFTINLTPTTGWDRELPTNGHGNGVPAADSLVDMDTALECGGEEVYMAADDEETTQSKDLPSVGKKAAHDPAVYRTGDDGEDDDGILFTNTPNWNTFSVVLRDQATMRFVKYVSQAAKGHRWDIKGEVELVEDAFAGEDDDAEGIAESDVEEEIEFDDNGDEGENSDESE